MQHIIEEKLTDTRNPYFLTFIINFLYKAHNNVTNYKKAKNNEKSPLFNKDKYVQNFNGEKKYILTPLTVTDFHMKVTQTSNMLHTNYFILNCLLGQGGIYVQWSYIAVVRDGRPLCLFSLPFTSYYSILTILTYHVYIIQIKICNMWVNISVRFPFLTHYCLTYIHEYMFLNTLHELLYRNTANVHISLVRCVNYYNGPVH